MSGFLLDSNAWVGLLKGHPAIAAGVARAGGLCVVTRNVSEFSRVPGLSIENWQDPG